VHSIYNSFFPVKLWKQTKQELKQRNLSKIPLHAVWRK